jgi:flagellar biogenesis protein FliO
MKKFLLIISTMCCFIFIQNNIYAEEDNIIIEKESLFAENSNENTYPIMAQPEYKPAFFKMLLILIALIALIFITFWLFRKFMKMRLYQTNLTKSIKILEKRTISPKSMLYLIELEGKKVLISESNLEIRKIKDID